MWRKGNPCVLFWGMQIHIATMENIMELPQKLKNKTTIESSNSISKYLKEMKTLI